MPENGPSVRFRRIGRTLRELREDANRSLRAAGRHLDRSPSNLSMIENGLQPIRPRSLAQILDYYGVRDPLRKSLLHLAEQGREKDWTRAFEGRVSAAALDFASLERDAAQIFSYQPNLIPGLMQKEGYIRAVMEASPDWTRDNEELIAFRLRRQRILEGDGPPALKAIVGEAALRQVVGEQSLQRDQLLHLGEIARRDHIAIRILPYSAGAHLGFSGPYDVFVLRPPGRLTVAVVDDLIRVSFREQEEEVAAYLRFFDHLWAVSLDEVRSLALIERLASEA